MARNQRESEILKDLHAAESPMSSMDLVQSIYKDTPPHLHRAAQFNVEHHLQKLMKEGRAHMPEEGKWSSK